MRHPVDLPREKRRGRLERDTHVNVLVAANRFEAEVEALCREEGISHHQYVALVRATARGRELFSRLARRLRGFHRSQWGSLADTELAQLDELLRRVLWHGQSAADAD